MYKVLIVEDDPVIAGAMKKQLDGWGFDAQCVGDFSDVMGAFAQLDPQLVLMDISLPFFNGYHWCAEIRRVSSVPVIFISSTSDNMNIVMAMNMGGDDFIAKPFDLDVLTAKVQALLRRAYDFSAAPPVLESGGAELNLADGSLAAPGGERVELTRNELRILSTLMERRGAVVSRETLMTALWETDSYVDDNTLTVNITRLRRKLDAAGLPDFIRTKKGIGYIVG